MIVGFYAKMCPYCGFDANMCPILKKRGGESPWADQHEALLHSAAYYFRITWQSWNLLLLQCFEGSEMLKTRRHIISSWHKVGQRKRLNVLDSGCFLPPLFIQKQSRNQSQLKILNISLSLSRIVSIHLRIVAKIREQHFFGVINYYRNCLGVLQCCQCWTCSALPKRLDSCGPLLLTAEGSLRA